MNLRKRFHDFYWKCKSWIYPELRFSQESYGTKLLDCVGASCRWLDVGCGRRLLPPWLSSLEKEVLQRTPNLFGIDPDHSSLCDNDFTPNKLQASLDALPFIDRTFDVVTANMVVEHLENPAEQFSEIARVLRPGGIFIFHTPNIYGYTTLLSAAMPEPLKTQLVQVLEGRASKDLFRTFYRANSQRRIRDCAKRAGLTLKELKFIGSDAELIVFPPLAILELLWIRICRASWLAGLRTNIICVLEKA